MTHYHGSAHKVLFYTLLLYGGVTGLQVLDDNLGLEIGALLLFTVALGCTIRALVKQQHSDFSRALKNTVWSTLVYLCVGFVVSILYSISILYRTILDVNQFARQHTSGNYHLVIAYQSLRTGPRFWSLYALFSLLAFFLGSAGLVLLKKSRR